MLDRTSADRGLSEEQRMMRQSCRDFVDEVVLPFIKQNWKLEWSMVPEDRLPPRILEEAEKSAFAPSACRKSSAAWNSRKAPRSKPSPLVAEEIARGDSGLADKLVQNWKVSVLLRQSRAAASAGKMVQAPGRRAAVPDGALPDRAARRLRPLASYNVPEAAMQTTAVKTNGGWVINGRKQFISNGYDASLYVVYANTNPKVGMLQGTSSFLVPRGNQRLHRRALQRDARLPLHEQWRDGVRGHVRARRSSAGGEQCAWFGRRLFPSRKDHPGAPRISASVCGLSRRPRIMCRITCRAAGS